MNCPEPMEQNTQFPNSQLLHGPRALMPHVLLEPHILRKASVYSAGLQQELPHLVLYEAA